MNHKEIDKIFFSHKIVLQITKEKINNSSELLIYYLKNNELEISIYGKDDTFNVKSISYGEKTINKSELFKELQSNNKLKFIVDYFKYDVALTLEESICDGPRGLSIKYYFKLGDKVEKIIIFGKDNSFKIKSHDIVKTLIKSELIDELKSNNKLKFTNNYLNNF
jgi:hypothetical protein